MHLNILRFYFKVNQFDINFFKGKEGRKIRGEVDGTTNL